MNIINILMSIKEEWWRAIESGEKTLEIRKSSPRKSGPFRVYFCVSGTKRIFGYAEVDKVVEMTAKEIADSGSAGSKLTLERLEKYAKGSKLYAWHITNVVRLSSPVKYKKHPPMSWVYVPVTRHKKEKGSEYALSA